MQKTFRYLLFAFALCTLNCGGESDQKKATVETQEAVKQGEYVENYPDGSLKTISNYDHQGRKHGLWSFWRKNGELWSETNYSHGKKHGPYRVWHPNGKLQIKGSYFEGEKVGTWTIMSEDGKEKTEKVYSAN